MSCGCGMDCNFSCPVRPPRGSKATCGPCGCAPKVPKPVGNSLCNSPTPCCAPPGCPPPKYIVPDPCFTPVYSAPAFCPLIPGSVPRCPTRCLRPRPNLCRPCPLPRGPGPCPPACRPRRCPPPCPCCPGRCPIPCCPRPCCGKPWCPTEIRQKACRPTPVPKERCGPKAPCLVPWCVYTGPSCSV